MSSIVKLNCKIILPLAPGVCTDPLEIRNETERVEAQCNQLLNISNPAIDIAPYECGCPEGYFRHDNGSCVKPEDCYVCKAGNQVSQLLDF